MKLSFDRSYCIDVDALIRLDVYFPKSNPTFQAVWQEVEELIEAGSFYTSEIVEKEVNEYAGKHTFIQNWMKQHKKKQIIPNNPEIIQVVGKVVNENLNTGFLDQKKWDAGIDEADPYLIAIGKVFGHIIITGESKEKPTGIPQVAAKYDVEAINIHDFFKERGLKMQKT